MTPNIMLYFQWRKIHLAFHCLSVLITFANAKYFGATKNLLFIPTHFCIEPENPHSVKVSSLLWAVKF